MKKIIALLLTVITVMMLLTSCGGSGSPDPEPTSKSRPVTTGKEENMLTTTMAGLPVTLDPDHFTLQVEDSIINQVYETLFKSRLDGNGLEYFLAEEVVLNEDGTVDVTLRDAKFHDGSQLTSEDVVYTFSRLELSALNSGIYGLVTFDVKDDRHFTMGFPFADQGGDFENLIPYMENVRIMNKAWTEARVEDINGSVGYEENGTGAYYLEKVTDGGDVYLKRFGDYWGTASIDTVKFKYYTGEESIAFEAGDTDFTTYAPAKLGSVEGLDNVKIEEVVQTAVTFLVIGCNEALPTSDIRVRQAIAYALNRADLADAASEGAAKPAYNIAPATVKYYTEDVEKFERDLQKSKDLLTQAGYSESNRVPIEIIVRGDRPQWVSTCELVKANLEESFFDVEITQLDSTARYFQADYEMGIISFAYTTDFKMYNILFDMSSGLDLAGIVDDAMLAEFSAITDEASAQKCMRDAIETVAYYPLFYPTTYFAYDDRLDLGANFGQYVVLFSEMSWK